MSLHPNVRSQSVPSHHYLTMAAGIEQITKANHYVLDTVMDRNSELIHEYNELERQNEALTREAHDLTVGQGVLRNDVTALENKLEAVTKILNDGVGTTEISGDTDTPAYRALIHALNVISPNVPF